MPVMGSTHATFWEMSENWPERSHSTLDLPPPKIETLILEN